MEKSFCSSFASLFLVPYELLHANSDCRPDVGWFGKTLGLSGCDNKCRELGHAVFVIASDNNCKCCTSYDGTATISANNFNIYRSVSKYSSILYYVFISVGRCNFSINVSLIVFLQMLLQL